VFSGIDSTVHAVDPRTGKALWTKPVGVYSHSMTTGTPSILKDRVIVPVAQFEISVAADNNHPCCTNHGYVLSLDPKTGAQQWRYDTMEDAKPLRDRGDGKMLMGPSGAPIWNSPVVDETRGPQDRQGEVELPRDAEGHLQLRLRTEPCKGAVELRWPRRDCLSRCRLRCVGDPRQGQRRQGAALCRAEVRVGLGVRA
jgi:hypothetical protein